MATVRRLPPFLTCLSGALFSFSIFLVAVTPGWPRGGLDESVEEVRLGRVAILTPAALAVLVLALACLTAAAVGRSSHDGEPGQAVPLSPLVGVMAAVVVVGVVLFLAA